MDTPLLLTYDNAPTDTTRRFIRTLEKNGWGYRLVGEGEVWMGFISKLKGYRNALESLPDNKLVILSDARDVLCLRGPTAFTEGFVSFNRDLVVSMEVLCQGNFDVPETFCGGQCIPLTAYWKHNNITSLPARKFANSGLIAGRASSLKTFLDWAIANNFTDDQLALCKYMVNFPERIGADFQAVLLHTSTFGVNAGIQSIHIQKNDSPTFAEIFGRGAFFLHIPGCVNKGQKIVYTEVCKVIDGGVWGPLLSDPYKYKEPTWNEKF